MSTKTDDKDKDKNTIPRIVIYKIKYDSTLEKYLSEKGYFEIQKGTIKGWNYHVKICETKNIIPPWCQFIRDIVGNQKIPLISHVSLVIFFEKEGNVFALTAGYGYSDVKEWAIPDYGIEIARKHLSPNHLDNLYQKVPTGSVFGLHRSLRGRYIPESDPINNKGVLKSLKGKGIDKSLGITLEGRTSLSISGKKNFNEVIETLDKILEIEKQQTYTVNIKGLEEVSKAKKEELEKTLVEKINNRDLNDCLFNYDDLLISNSCNTIKIGSNDDKYQIDDIESIFEAIKNQKKTNIASTIIFGYDDTDREIFRKKLIDLVECELSDGTDTFFRIDKRWYKTNEDYKQTIEDEFKKINSIGNDYFGPWSKQNGSYIKESDFISQNIDSNKIQAHTYKINQIEFADIIDNNNNYLIHIKRGKGAFLRVLFAQAFVSGDLFTNDSSFKVEVKNKFGIDCDQKYTIVFAIFPEEEKQIDKIFTLFAKVDFLERCKTLEDMGFNIKYCLINPESSSK